MGLGDGRVFGEEVAGAEFAILGGGWPGIGGGHAGDEIFQGEIPQRGLDLPAQLREPIFQETRVCERVIFSWKWPSLIFNFIFL
jgi:hypothetical protein